MHLDDLLPQEEARQVHGVGVQVAMGAGACLALLEAPGHRGVGAAPVLQVAGADMVDPAEPALAQQPPGQGHGGAAAVVEPDEGFCAGGLGGIAHGAGILEGAGQRLLAGHVLPRLQHRDRLLGVQMVGRADVHQRYTLVLRQVPPVGGPAAPPPPRGEARQFSAIAAAGHRQLRRQRQVEEPRRLAPAVAVGAAHEFLADEGNGQRSRHLPAGKGEQGTGNRERDEDRMESDFSRCTVGARLALPTYGCPAPLIAVYP